MLRGNHAGRRASHPWSPTRMIGHHQQRRAHSRKTVLERGSRRAIGDPARLTVVAGPPGQSGPRQQRPNLITTGTSGIVRVSKHHVAVLCGRRSSPAPGYTRGTTKPTPRSAPPFAGSGGHSSPDQDTLHLRSTRSSATPGISAGPLDETLPVLKNAPTDTVYPGTA